MGKADQERKNRMGWSKKADWTKLAVTTSTHQPHNFQAITIKGNFATNKIISGSISPSSSRKRIPLGRASGTCNIVKARDKQEKAKMEGKRAIKERREQTERISIKELRCTTNLSLTFRIHEEMLL